MNFTTVLQVAQAPRAFSGLLALLLLSACSGSPSTGNVSPERSDPRSTIDQFMAAVKNDDLLAMSRLWGTENGPAADRMDPVVAERRLRLMQIYLEHETYEVRVAEGELLGRNVDMSKFQVHIKRRNCTPVVPFTLVMARDGWLIENIDLAEAGNPARRCPNR